MPITDEGVQLRPSTANNSEWPRFADLALPWLIFACCFAYLCIFLHYSTIEPDEGIVLQGAERVLAGQIPYRDFFSFYTPGSFYLVAALFRFFGDSFLVARLSLAVAGALGSAITYILARQVCSRGVSVFAAILATTAGSAFRFLVLHNVYSTLACCICLYAAIRAVETKKTAWAFATGSLASFTFLIEQSKGGGLYIGLALAFTLLHFLNRQNAPGKTRLLACVLGCVWPLILTVTYFAAHRAAGIMLQDWLWPLHYYSQANRVPYGYQNWSDRTRELIFSTGPVPARIIKVLVILPGFIVPVLPLLAIGVLIYCAVQIRRGHDETEASHYILMSSIMAGLLLSVVTVRADILHFMYLAPLWYVMLAWILGAQGVRNRKLLAARVPLMAFVCLVFGLLSMAMLSSATGARERVVTRRGPITAGNSETVIQYVQAKVEPGGALLVYPYLPLYNYLTATVSPSRFDYFQPGMNTAEQGEEIIDSLKRSHAPVLFEPQFLEKVANSWPATPASVFASDSVSTYIAKNYRICKLLRSPEGWRLEFMVRTNQSCP